MGYWRSLEWLALIASFAYPTVGYFLAGDATCSLALALDERDGGDAMPPSNVYPTRLGIGMHGIKAMNHENFTCVRTRSV